MANKNKAKDKHGGAPRKSKRLACAGKVDYDSISETWDSVGHLFSPIPDAEIKKAKLLVKRSQKMR